MAFDFPTGPGENYARRISLGDDFMNWAIDDLLYGYLFYHATYDKEGTQQHYLQDYKWRSIRPAFVKGMGVSARTISNHLDKLIERGLITHDEKKQRYLFNCETVPYIWLNGSLLRYLITTANNNVIIVYIYLLSKYRYFTGDDYQQDYFDFTLKDLLEKALKYSNKSHNMNAVKNLRIILFDLAKRGLIEVEQAEKLNRDGTNYHVFRLTFIAETFGERKRIVDENNFKFLLGGTSLDNSAE